MPKLNGDTQYNELRNKVINNFNDLDVTTQESYLREIESEFNEVIRNRNNENTIDIIVKSLWQTNPPLKRIDVSFILNLGISAITNNEKKIIRALSDKFNIPK